MENLQRQAQVILCSAINCDEFDKQKHIWLLLSFQRNTELNITSELI